MNKLQLAAAIAVLSVHAAIAAPESAPSSDRSERALCVSYDSENQLLGCRTARLEVVDGGEVVDCRGYSVRVITAAAVARCPEPVIL